MNEWWVKKQGCFWEWWTKKQIKKIWKLGSHASFLLSITSYILHSLLWRARQKSAVGEITECVICLNEMETIPLKLCSASTKIQAFQGQILYEAAQIWSALYILISSSTWGERNAASKHVLSFLNNFVVGDKVAWPSLKT